MRRTSGIGRLSRLLLLLLLTAGLTAPEIVRAELAGDQAFANTSWTIAFEDDIQSPQGVVQSITATEDYIITIENTADGEDVPDTVSAYYRNSVDELGNPVEQYGLAKRVQADNWEHGNGMTYNPRTGKIYVAFYTSYFGDGSHAGCIQEMDPETLRPGELIRIGDGSYNILGIGYLADTDQYVIQTNADGGFSLKLLDHQFQIIDDFGPIETSPGANFQDLEVDGDYVMIYLMTYGMGIGEWMDVFSLSQRKVVLNTSVGLSNMEQLQITEAEGMVQLDPGHFLSTVTVTQSDGQRKVRFYETRVPYLTPSPTPSPSPELTEAESEPEMLAPETAVPTDPPSGRERIAEGTRTLGKGLQQVQNMTGTAFRSLLKAGASGADAIRKLVVQIGNWAVTLRETVSTQMLPPWIGFAPAGAAALLAGPGTFLYMMHLRRARRRINARIKRMRKAVIAQVEAESDFLEEAATWEKPEPLQTGKH